MTDSASIIAVIHAHFYAMCVRVCACVYICALCVWYMYVFVYVCPACVCVWTDVRPCLICGVCVCGMCVCVCLSVVHDVCV